MDSTGAIVLLVYSIGTVATMPKVFSDQPQLKINVLRKCYNTYYYHNIFTIIEISVSYRSNKKKC